MSQKPLIFFDARMIDHNPGELHPESPERLKAISHMLDQLPADLIERRTALPANRADLERIHSPEYIDSIDALCNKTAQLDPDTRLSPDSVQAAYLAAGTGIQALDALFDPSTTTRRAFCFTRPPGHHAEHSHAMGFCVFNNIAVAAAYATEHLGLERVLIIDWDVHHGNGTQHSFKSRADVLVFNIHQSPFFPESGRIHELGSGHGTGFTINVPLPPGQTDDDYRAAFEQVLIPIAEKYAPQLVLVSAGFDAHHDDPIGDMNLTTQGFTDLCNIAIDIAERHANGRIALFLEGGYHIPTLTECTRACIFALANQQQTAPTPSKTTQPVFDHLHRLLAPLWSFPQ